MYYLFLFSYLITAPDPLPIQDVWRVSAWSFGKSIKKYKMYIFNQWGALIFESYNIDETWCGKMQNSEIYCPQGVYKYVIEIEDLIGEIHSYSGEVHLSR